MSFPVDDLTLTAVEHALGGSLTLNTAGDPVIVGADFSMSRLLDFLSGYDPTLLMPLLDRDGHALPDMVEYPGTIYHRDDVIAALICEVRRLRLILAGREGGG